MMRDSYTMIPTPDGWHASDNGTREWVELITGVYPPPILSDDQCPGCPAGIKGWFTINGDKYCGTHLDQVINGTRLPGDYDYHNSGDEYTGPTFMEYED